ncbi:WD40-repeat-containing domain protein [Phycomyces nitens]|nr:WD40-repeat-containing domain protein [Phycomyces nitens]
MEEGRGETESCTDISSLFACVHVICHTSEASRSMTQLIAEREKRIRESDKLEMQKASTTNEVLQVNLQIEELMNKRKLLEGKWAKLESKDRHLRASIEEITDAMAAIEDEGRDDGSVRSRRGRSTKEEESEEEMESGTCFKTFEGHDDRILALDFNHPRGIMVSSSMDGTVRAWDLHRSRCLGTLEGHTSLVRCLQLDNTRLITGSDDGTIKQWDLSVVSAPSPSSVSSFSVYSSEPSSPTLSAFTTPDEVIPLPSECYLGSFEGHLAEVTALYADENTAVSGSNDKTMKQWDLETRQCVLTLDVMWASKSTEATNSWSSFDRWSLDGLQQSLFEPASDFVGALQFWNFALASGTLDGKIRMWDLRTGQTHRTLPGHNGPVTSLQFDEVHLVSGSTDKTIRIWDLRTGSVFDTLSYTGPVTSLQFDSGKIVSAGSTSSIDVYNRTSFQHNTLAGHTGAVNSVRFRKNVLASGGKDKVVKLWTL